MKKSFMLLALLCAGLLNPTISYAGNPTPVPTPVEPIETIPKCPSGYAQMGEVNCTAKGATYQDCQANLTKCLQDEAQYCKDNGAELYPSLEEEPGSATRLSRLVTPIEEQVTCTAKTRLCCAKKPNTP